MALAAEELRLDRSSEIDSRSPASRRDLRWVLCTSGVAALALFLLASVRHAVHRSGAMDLGFFDQAVWLISRGQTPVSSLLGFHVLGDHASLILYPVAIAYLLLPTPYVLLAIQSIALSAGAWPVWKLAQLSGLSGKQSRAVAAAYLMYPVLLTSSIFDFHPDALAVPALLMAILAAREARLPSFCLWVFITLSCKEVLSLTIVGLGIWLLLFERRRVYGLVAIGAGVVWFILATRLLIPYFGNGRDPSGVQYYQYLGQSLSEILTTLVLRPGIVLHRVLSTDSLIYAALILGPIGWGIHRKALAPLLAAAPVVLLNLLSENTQQRSPFFQYSLPVIPFVFTAIILALARNVAWIRNPKPILAWSTAVLALGFVSRVGRINSSQAMDWDTLHHTRHAIRLIDPQARVLTTFETVPHLSQREVIEYIGAPKPLRQLGSYDFILLSTRHSSLDWHDEKLSEVLAGATVSPAFELAYAGPDVFLFRRTIGGLVLNASPME